MIALLLALLSFLSGAGFHASANHVSHAAATHAAKPVPNPFTGHPLAG